MAAFGALVLTAAAMGCGSDDGGGGSGSTAAGGDRTPLRIALITPTSGPLAIFGKDAINGWQLAADEVNAKGGIDGHRVELITADTDTNPARTVRAARRAVTQDKAQYIGGVFTSPENGALQQQLPSMNAISINAIAQDDSLTGENCSPNAFRLVQNASMNSALVAESLSKLPAKKWAIIAADYNTGHTAAKNFKAGVEKNGGTVVAEEFSPLGTTEYGSYISKLKNADADGLFMYVIGADAPAFINQAAQFKLFDQYKTVLGQNVVSEPLFEALGKNVVGFYNNLGYSATIDTPRNKAFVDAYKAKYGKDPYYVPADNYVGALALFEAVRKADSVDPAKVRTALNGLTFESLDGPVTIRAEDHQALRKNYLGQVVENGGSLGWKITAEVDPSVSTPQPNPDCKLQR
jgi:ABC-type branched-subunit amino acid transport system substrate-binding protein